MAATQYETWLRTRAMPLNAESKYPTRRAYVVKLRSDARSDALAGRLENLVTGSQRDFASAQELIESIATDLGRSAREPTVKANPE
jgi:hypothetical protein